MSTLKVTALKNPSSSSNNLVLNTDGTVVIPSYTSNNYSTSTYASNNYSTSTYVSNTYFQNNGSSTLHILQLEGKVTNETFGTSESILTGTHYRNDAGLGFNVGGITWNTTNGRVTVPEAGVYSVFFTIYENGSATGRLRIAINGVQKNVLHFGPDNQNKTYNCFFNLNANDYVEIQQDATGSYNSATWYTGTVHTWFTIQFLG